MSSQLFFRSLGVCYGFAAFLHLLDVLDLRLKFSEMTLPWKIWIATLLIADLFAFVGLWNQKRWGARLFVTIAVVQLIAYAGVLDSAKNQIFLIVFHIACLIAYYFIQKRTELS